jgi:hypothetical protein
VKSVVRAWLERRRLSQGRILAVKWGYNPNSSSLGVDVTFLLLGLSAITVVTPLVSLLLRTRSAAASRDEHLPGHGPLDRVDE